MRDLLPRVPCCIPPIGGGGVLYPGRASEPGFAEDGRAVVVSGKLRQAPALRYLLCTACAYRVHVRVRSEDLVLRVGTGFEPSTLNHRLSDKTCLKEWRRRWRVIDHDAQGMQGREMMIVQNTQASYILVCHAPVIKRQPTRLW